MRGFIVFASMLARIGGSWWDATDQCPFISPQVIGAAFDHGVLRKSIVDIQPPPPLLVQSLQNWELGSSWEPYRQSIECYNTNYWPLATEHNGSWVIVSFSPRTPLKPYLCKFEYFKEKPSQDMLSGRTGSLFKIGEEFPEQNVREITATKAKKMHHIPVKYTLGARTVENEFLVDVGTSLTLLKREDLVDSDDDAPPSVVEYVNISNTLYMRRYAEITRIGSHVFQKPIYSYVTIPIEKKKPASLGYVMGLDVILQAKLVHFKCGGEMKFYWNQLRLSPLPHGLRLTSNSVEFSRERGPHGEVITVVAPSSRFQVNLTTVMNGTQTPALIDTGSGVSVQLWNPAIMQQRREMKLSTTPFVGSETSSSVKEKNGTANQTKHRRRWANINVLGNVYEANATTTTTELVFFQLGLGE